MTRRSRARACRARRCLAGLVLEFALLAALCPSAWSSLPPGIGYKTQTGPGESWVRFSISRDGRHVVHIVTGPRDVACDQPGAEGPNVRIAPAIEFHGVRARIDRRGHFTATQSENRDVSWMITGRFGREGSATGTLQYRDERDGTCRLYASDASWSAYPRVRARSRGIYRGHSSTSNLRGTGKLRGGAVEFHASRSGRRLDHFSFHRLVFNCWDHMATRSKLVLPSSLGASLDDIYFELTRRSGERLLTVSGFTLFGAMTGGIDTYDYATNTTCVAAWHVRLAGHW